MKSMKHAMMAAAVGLFAAFSPAGHVASPPRMPRMEEALLSTRKKMKRKRNPGGEKPSAFLKDRSSKYPGDVLRALRAKRGTPIKNFLIAENIAKQHHAWHLQKFGTDPA